jgi:hypothetical protein
VPARFGDDEEAPAVFGAGRPFFGTGGVAEPLVFEDPEVVQGRRVTHLAYDVRR